MMVLTVLVFYPPKRKKDKKEKKKLKKLLKREFSPVENYYSSEFNQLPVPGVKLKDSCCEKFKKGKRCRRCPCFDL